MNRKWCVFIVVATIAVGSLALTGLASDAQMYFSSDKNGQNRVANVQEGDEIWIVVIDNDQNIDCDIRDKMSPDLKIMDPKTGAYIVWDYNTNFDPENIAGDYLEETGADTGVFVSVRAFQIGTRLDFAAGTPWTHTHVVDVPVDNVVDDFQWGHYMYIDAPGGDDYEDNRVWFGDGGVGTDPDVNEGFMAPGPHPERPDESLALVNGGEYLIGRFENMDTLIGMYQDPNDATDVTVAMMKIIDTEATISWNQEIYKDANGSASITVVDLDENLNCNEVEYVPVFIIVNPGSWWNADGRPTNFCMLKRTGGIDALTGDVANVPIRWHNIYNAHANAEAPISNGAGDGRYYIEYGLDLFDTVNAGTPVSFYAQETGVNTGVFQLNLNSILTDLEFNQLFVRDVLVAYYLDPNDFDDFTLATAYIEEKQHSNTTFTGETRAEKDVFWIGRDPVYVQVIDANANVDPCCPEQVLVHICDPHGEDDAEWLILDETSSNSPVFFTFSGTQLRPVWDALGVGVSGSEGGFWLQVDNWKLEVFNEDTVYVRYNDVYYATGDTGLGGLGDIDTSTAFPPVISRPRVRNDVSFDLMSIADTQVYDGSDTNMWFLDRQGNRVSGYVNNDCVFIEVLDLDQDEDQYRRERIDGHWDGAQNIPFGPALHDGWACGPDPGEGHHEFNNLLGHTSIFNEDQKPKVYVLNPRSGYWASVDLLETGPATGDFVSVICIDLTNVYECVPQLGVLPGDTILAFYQDPSNHSDSAMISVKVGIGGGGTVPGTGSTTTFVDEGRQHVESYAEGDLVYVLVTDPSRPPTLLTGALTVGDLPVDLNPIDGQAGIFVTDGLALDLPGGSQLTATYIDPADPVDVSSDTIVIVAGMLEVDGFYAGPNPFETEVTFGFNGTGIASQMTVCVYNLAGKMVWETTQTDVSEIRWDGIADGGLPAANGAYIFTIMATDGTNTFEDTGKIFISR